MGSFKSNFKTIDAYIWNVFLFKVLVKKKKKSYPVIISNSKVMLKIVI